MLVEGGKGFVDAVLRQLDPWAPLPDELDLPALTIREGSRDLPLGEFQNLAGDGWVTAHDGRQLVVLAGGRTCSLPDATGLMVVEPGFPTRRLMSIVRPALQIRLLESGIPVLHAACVEINGSAVLVAGWSESGKTETALALVERGGAFLSDKWTILLPGARAAAFPIGVGIRRWVLRYLPRLRSNLPRGARTQLRIAAIAATTTAPIRRRAWPGPLGMAADLTRRAVELGDRAGLSPSELRDAYRDTGDPNRTPPISLVAVLRTNQSAEVSVTDGDPAQLSARLAVSAATEREPFIALRRRAAYAEAVPLALDDLFARDAAAIQAVLGRVSVVDVTSPFPTDPREVARQIEARL